jgi:general secretion pathway protein L
VSTTVLFLPTASGTGYRWMRLVDDRVVGRGDGLPVPSGDDGPTVAIAPADAVTLHWAELPGASPAQTVAAARLLAADASAAPVAELHVAVGDEQLPERPIGVVAASQMRAWLERLASDGVDADRLLPAPMLLPRPDQGFVRAEIGGQRVARGATTGFADEEGLADLVFAGEPTETLDLGALEHAIAAAVAAPVLDLRQGAFARRRSIGIDWALVRRLAWLALAILSITLLIDVVRIVRLELAADSVEARTEALARSGLPAGETVNDAGRQLSARLAGLRGPGQGFTRTAAVLFAVVQAVPGSELSALSFQPDGTLRATVSVPTEGAALDLRTRLERAGLAAAAGTFTSANGRYTGDLTVTAR